MKYLLLLLFCFFSCNNAEVNSYEKKNNDENKDAIKHERSEIKTH